MKVATFITMTVAAVAVSVNNAEQGSSLRQELKEVVKELEEEKKNKDDAWNKNPEEHLELLILDENKDPVLDVEVDVGEIKSKIIEQKHGHLAQGTGRGTLTVYLDKATNLADKDVGGGSDPYVTLHVFKGGYILYSDADYGTQTSTTINNTEDPIWDETFTFTGIESLDDLVLEVKVEDSDYGFDDSLGSCEIKLDEMNLSSTPTGVDRVIDAGFWSDSEIYLEISYSPN